MRGRSYTPSPPRGYGRRGRSPPRGGRHGRGDAPTSLLVRNLRHDCRPEDLRRPFGQFGPLKDIYLPRDYYSGEPRGFGFVQYVDPDDAAEAKYQMDGQVLQGRELTVVFAEENRKKPNEMRSREPGRGRAYDQRRSPPRYSRSPPPRNGRSRSRDYYSPSKRRYSRAVSPHGDRGRERSYSRSPVRERSPPHDGRRYSREKSYSRSPAREQSPPYDGQRNRGGSPLMDRSPGRGRSHSRSRSPYPPEYSRGEMGRDRSPSH